MTNPDDQRGTAMIAVLGLIALLLPLGAFVVLQVRMDLQIQRNLRVEVEAFYVAEAGLEHAVAEITPGTSFGTLFLGPDRRPGTADDGVFPFVAGPPPPFPAMPFRYDVRVSQQQAGMVELISTGSGQSGATKVLAAMVTRSQLPYTPAAFYVDDAAAVDLGSADLMVSGLDHCVADLPTAPSGSAAAVPGVATSSAEGRPELSRQLSGLAGRVVGTGESPSIATAAPPDVQAIVAACAQRPLPIAPTVSNAVLGSINAPQLAITAGDLDVTGQLSGAGILVVRGTLRISGSFSFAGLVVVQGGVIGEPSSDVRVTGALWRIASQDPRLRLQGHGAIAYSSAALSAVDGAFPGLLPHAAVVAEWQEML